MPLYVVLLVFMAVDAAFLAVTATLGMSLADKESIYRHYLLGMLASMFTCFIHVLVLFYLIGTGKDVREAVGEHPDLAGRYVPWTRRQKRRAFPPACFAIASMIVAALMGGEVHSRLLAVDGGRTLPVRGVPAWWVHLLFVGIAIALTAYAFVVEVATVRENRRAILEINAELERRAGSGAS